MWNDGYSYRRELGGNARGHTVHSYLCAFFSHSTPGQWRERLETGEVLVDGQPAESSQALRPGQVLTWNRPPWQEAETPQSFAVVYQDEHLLVVDKPSGLPTLPGGGFYRNTLLHRVQSAFPSARPVHRLGRGTSGLVLFAKDSETATRLQRSWPDIRKQYRALGAAVAADDQYDIHCPIGRCAHPRLGMVHGANANGKSARSVARVVERRKDSTLFEVDLHTGRPHQIRIHLAFIGHPLVGDPLYTVGGVPRSDQPALPGELGYCLQAQALRLTHPWTGKLLEVEATIPPILRRSSALG